MGDAMDNLGRSSVYSALPFDDSFRLLELEPSTDFTSPIVCHLRPSRHSDHPKYHALSYSWQSDEADAPPMSIRCNGHNMEIGSNLWHALRRLRQTDTTKVVWADALCINQADTAERNHQVRQMGAVYSGAELVVVWLGEAPPPETGIDIEAGLLAMVAVRDSWHNDHESVRSSIDERHAAGIPIPVEDLQIFDRYSRRLTPVEARSVAHIYQRAWFRRLWVVQEVMLAKDSLVMLDAYEIPWSIVVLVAQFVRGAPEVAAVVGDAVEPYRAIESACKIQHMWTLCNGATRFLFEFHDLLVLTRGMQCQDARDRIFGLLAVPTTSQDGKMEADYGISAGEAFRRVAMGILQVETAGSLDLLSDCQHEAGMEPWLSGPRGYPSWVPQWHINPHMRLLPSRWETILKRYRAAGSKRTELEWTKSGHPRVKGVEIARVKEASRMLTDDCFKRSDGKDQESVFKTTTSPPTGSRLLLPGTSTPLAVPQDRAKLLELMLRTLSGLPSPGGTRIKQYAAVLMKGYLRWSLPGVSNGGYDFQSAWDHRFCEEVDNLLGNVLGTEDGLLSWIKMTCANRRLFLTEDGEVGLGPGVMRPGDVVCVLYGMRVPIVLRRIGDTYVVVGECYVDGLIKGGAVGEDLGLEDSRGVQFVEFGDDSEGVQFREVVERWFELV